MSYSAEIRSMLQYEHYKFAAGIGVLESMVEVCLAADLERADHRMVNKYTKKNDILAVAYRVADAGYTDFDLVKVALVHLSKYEVGSVNDFLDTVFVDDM